MSGYTPVFRSVFDGSLHGKWPETGVWLALLAMADRNGHIDRTPQAIASDIGIDVDTLLRCLDAFCGPDPMSRTREHDGRRLELIDPEAKWGWRLINHSKYREKARKSAFDAARTADGRNADRMAARRDPTRPAMTRDDPPSNTNTNINTEEEKKGAGAPPFDPQSVPCLDVQAWESWVSHRKAIRKPIRPHSMPAAAKQLAALGPDQAREVERAIAGGWQGLHPASGGAKPRALSRADAIFANLAAGPNVFLEAPK